MRLLLVRHGQTYSNIARAIDTAYPGAELTDLGRQQAQRLAASLAGERIDVIAASTLLRAQQTAGPAAEARDLSVLTFDGLREIDAGDLEMNTDSASSDIYQGVMASWSTGELDVQMPGGTTGHEFLARFDEAIQAIEAATAAAAQGAGETLPAADAATAVVVSHGASIRAWVAIRCDGVDVVATVGPHLVNTGMFILEGSTRTGWRLGRRIDPIEDCSPVPA